MPRFPAAVRHVAAYRLAFAITALTVMVTTASAATAAGFVGATTGAAVRRTLAAGSILVTAPVTQTAATATDRQVTGTLRVASAGLPLTVTTSSWSQPLNLPASLSTGGTQAQAQVISLPELPRHARLVSGTWPGPPAGGLVSVAVPAGAARLLHLAPGQLLTLDGSSSRLTVRARISGVFQPRAGSYWLLSPLRQAAVSREAGFASYGPLVTTAGTIAGGTVPMVSRAWLAVPQVGAITAGNLAAVGTQLAAADGALANSVSAVVTSGLPGTLQALATGLAVARSQLLIGVLILLVIAGATLVVAIRLLGAQRAGEAPLLMARGASRRQLARRGLAEAAALAIPAAIVGPLVAGLVVPLLLRHGPLAAAGIRLDPGRPAAVWLAAAAVAVYSAIIIALPWLRQPLSPLQQRAGRSRQRVIATTASAGADIALIAIAAVAVWQLARSPAATPSGLATTAGVDPVLAVAPVLALGAGTLVMLRLLPLAARLADRGAARGRGLTFAAAAWQLSRKPVQQGGPALLAVLAVATSVLALATFSSWQRSVTQQAGFSVGGAARVTLPQSVSLPIGGVAAVTGARGVTASTPAVRTQVSLPGSGTGTLLALNGAAAAAIVPAGSTAGTATASSGAGGSRARGTGALSAAALLRRLGRSVQPAGAVLPGRPARIVVTARLSPAPAGSPVLALQLTDAAGVGYLLTAGALPADGRVHRLVVTIGAGADYPLRLRGFSLQYLMPQGHPATAVLSIDSVSTASASTASASTASASTGPAGQVAPVPGPALVSSDTAVSVGAGTTDPAVTGTRRGPTGLSVTFRTGSGQSSGPQAGAAGATLTVGAGPPTAPLAGIATAAFLAATGDHLGSTVSVQVQGAPVSVTLMGEVSRFPTVSGLGGALIVDQAALQAALLQGGIQPAPVGEWWLRTRGTPRIAGLPAGTSVTSAATVAAGLRAQPLSAASQEELLAVAAIALLLAGAGFAVSVAAGRDRAHDTALLDALGARPGQVAMLLCLEQAMLAVPAAVAGLALGALLSHLIIPAVSLTAQATLPVPPVGVHVPVLPALLVAAVIAAVPPLAAALTGLRRLQAATTLRVEAEV
jgi:hypothetical protein